MSVYGSLAMVVRPSIHHHTVDGQRKDQKTLMNVSLYVFEHPHTTGKPANHANSLSVNTPL